jgi:DNA-binding NtrC family response regulator
MSPAAERLLVEYPWPGNIRELKNLMERTVLLETGPVLDAQQLKIAPRSRPASEATLGQRVDEYLTAPIPAAGIPFETLTEDLERALIMRASYATKWNQSRTAELLNLKRDKLRYRMKLYGIRCGRAESEANDGRNTRDEAAA